VILNSEERVFPCSSCGLCCRKVGLALETKALDRGDGVCRHLDEDTRLCSIYATRPDICRVAQQYDLNYRQRYSWEEFVAINLAICHKLQIDEL
jgi:Fe-S-cluster containining protein